MRLAAGTAALVAAALMTFAVLSANVERLELDGQFAEGQGRPSNGDPLSDSLSRNGEIGGRESDDGNEDSEDGPAATATSNGVDLWVVDEKSDRVFEYSEDGTLLRTFSLTSANRDSKGVATDGTSIWVLDRQDKRVYRYNMSGQFQDSFDLTTPSHHLEGITTDGNGLWVVDEESGVFRYSLSGAFQSAAICTDVVGPRHAAPPAWHRPGRCGPVRWRPPRLPIRHCFRPEFGSPAKNRPHPAAGTKNPWRDPAYASSRSGIRMVAASG